MNAHKLRSSTQLFLALCMTLVLSTAGAGVAQTVVQVPLEPQVINGDDVSVTFVQGEHFKRDGKRNNNEVSINHPSTESHIEYVHEQAEDVTAQRFVVDVLIPTDPEDGEQNAYIVHSTTFPDGPRNTLIVTIDAMRQKIDVSFFILGQPIAYEQGFDIETGQTYTVEIVRHLDDPDENYVGISERYTGLPNSDPVSSFKKTFKEMGIDDPANNLDTTFHAVGSNDSKARFWRAMLENTFDEGNPIIRIPLVAALN